ncbi:hypothetical protein PENTCL1PPCAC_3342, partial [Pristionchus entomophagus]
IKAITNSETCTIEGLSDISSFPKGDQYDIEPVDFSYPILKCPAGFALSAGIPDEMPFPIPGNEISCENNAWQAQFDG